MKRNLVRTILFTTLLLSLAPLASARDHHYGACSNASLAGEWGYTFTGSLIGANGVVPFAAVGKFTLDAWGSFSAAQTSSTGNASQDMVKGTITVNSDCTGTLTASIYDKPGTTLLRTAQWAIVIDDNESEMRGIITSLVQASGASVPAIVTMSGRRLFPHRDE